jgi:hypothetical protein
MLCNLLVHVDEGEATWRCARARAARLRLSRCLTCNALSIFALSACRAARRCVTLGRRAAVREQFAALEARKRAEKKQAQGDPRSVGP